MSRIYTAEFDNVAATTAAELFGITPASNKPILIWRVEIGQSTELGDAQEEQLRVQVIRGHTSAGSGGATVTPQPNRPSDPAAGFTARRMDTTLATGGTPVNLWSGTFNVRTGLFLEPVQPFFCSTSQSRINVRLVAAPADSITFSGTITVEEF